MDSSCKRTTSLCIACLEPREGEAGLCGASHLRWGGDFDLPPPSSSVFFCSQYRPGLSHSRSASEACTCSAVLFRSHLPGRWGRCQSCRWRTGAHGGLRTFVDLGGGEPFPQVRIIAVVRNMSSRGRQTQYFPLAREFGAPPNGPLGLSFLFTVLVCRGCHNKVPQTGWFKLRVLQFWRPEV